MQLMSMNNPLPIPKSRLRNIFRFFLWGIGSVLLCLLGVMLFFFFAEPYIKQKLIQELNNRLTVAVQVKKIDYSVWRKFPEMTISFSGVSVSDPLRRDSSLLKAEEIGFTFTLADVLSDSLTIQTIYVNRAILSLYTDKSGKNNFSVFKQEGGSAAFQSLHLRKMLFTELQWHYRQNQSNTSISGNLRNSQISLLYQPEMIQLAWQGKLFLSGWSSKGRYVSFKKTVDLTADLNYTSASKRFQVQQAVLSMSSLKTRLSGFFTNNYVSLRASADGSSAAEILQLLPDAIAQKCAAYHGDGRYHVEALVEGDIAKGKIPRFLVEGKLSDATLFTPHFRDAIQKLNLEFRLDNQTSSGGEFEVPKLSFHFQDRSFRARLRCVNFLNPQYAVEGEGSIAFRLLEDFVPDTILSKSSGRLSFKNLRIQFQSGQDVKRRIEEFGYGEVELTDVGFSIRGKQYEGINGTIIHTGDWIEVPHLQAQLPGAAVIFSGKVKNLVAFAFNLDQERKSAGEILGIDGALSISRMDINQLIEAFSPPVKKSKPKLNVAEVFQMSGQLAVEVDQLIYRQLDVRKVALSLTLQPGRVKIDSLSALVFQGKLLTQADVGFTRSNDVRISFATQLRDWELTQLFRQAENFGQQTLTDQQVSGELSADLSGSILLRNMREPDWQSLETEVNLSVQQGALRQFSPLHAASKFIRIEELNNIRFSEIKNRFMIHDRKIIIPEMEVRSSAINLMLWGTHDFNNEVDYHLKVNLNKLLAGKFKRNRRDAVEYIEEDSYSGFNLFLSIAGTLPDVKVKLDKKESSQRLVADVKGEKEVLKNLMRREKPGISGDKRTEEKYFSIPEAPAELEFEE